MFADRKEAGAALAAELEKRGIENGVVMAIPRGGVVVGAEIARRLQLPLDLIIPRKIGAPQSPEMAVGAVTQDGTAIIDHSILKRLGLDENDLAGKIEQEVREIKRRMHKYRGSDDYPDHTGKEIILVDDGVATGSTVLAAIRSLYKLFQPSKLILAVPVAPPEVMARLREEVDEAVCLEEPEIFYAVGQFYQDFKQVSDREVTEIINSLHA